MCACSISGKPICWEIEKRSLETSSPRPTQEGGGAKQEEEEGEGNEEEEGEGEAKDPTEEDEDDWIALMRLAGGIRGSPDSPAWIWRCLRRDLDRRFWNQ